MDVTQRRNEMLKLLQMDMKPMSASNLAEHFDVSRQVIVGDIALLRASGVDIVATPKGYVLGRKPENLDEEAAPDSYVIACRHDKASLEDELYSIVDNGGALLGVSVEHPIYGTISQKMDIKSRYDADQFLGKIAVSGASLLCSLTGGAHMHTVRCLDEDVYRRILMQLKEKGLLFTK